MNRPTNFNNNYDALSISLDSLFNVGDLVLVDKCFRAYILAKYKDPNNTTLLTLCHVIGNSTEHNVSLSRCEVISLSHSTQTRSGFIRNNWLTAQSNRDISNTSQQTSQSLTSTATTIPNNTTTNITHHNNSSSANTSNSTNTNQISNSISQSTNRTVPTMDEFKNCMIQSCFPRYKHHISINNPNSFTDDHPLYCFLFKYKNQERGWLRKLIHEESNCNTPLSLQSHLSKQESMVLTLMSSLLSGSSFFHRKMSGHVNMICHALSINAKTRKRNFLSLMEDDFIFEDAQSSRKRKTIFNDEDRRKQVFTGFNSYKKMQTKKFRETSERVPIDILKDNYDKLDNETKHSLDVMAQRDLVRSRSLWGELCDILLKSKGKVSYEKLANHLSNIVDKTTIMRHLKDQEGFTTRKDRILPSLDKAAQERRVKWAETFWMFWKCVKCCPSSKVKFVLVHMDEKWFYAIVTRANCKVLTSIGLEPTDYYAHHKNHVGKELYIVVTAYVLNNNDITGGGKAIPISCIRVGEMLPAQKNTYKRVYKNDGSYHYPPIAENLLRKRGQEYFKPMELNGSTTGTSKNPKVSLLQKYIDEIIPDIEQKIVDRFGSPETRVCIVKQEDGAGLHTDGTYLKTMNDLFRVRDWLLFNQPSQSPVTNIHDACIFPMMSKAVSTEQSLNFGSRMLVGEQLNQSVMKVWNDNTNLVAMSRAFAGHSQIVCAILEHKGDNKYLSEKGGLSFGVRRTYVCDREGEGVIPISLAPTNEAETTQGLITNDLFERGMKYSPPDIRTLEKGNLSKDMRELLNMYMDKDLMTDEVYEFFYREEETLYEHGVIIDEECIQHTECIQQTVQSDLETVTNDTNLHQM